MRLSEYVDDLIARGKCTFSLSEAYIAMRQHEPDRSRLSIINSIARLVKKRELISLAKGFYVIVSPEYRSKGSLPPEFFLPYLMEFWRKQYYVGLLSAAAYHGAAHQKPQVFQVVSNVKKSRLKCGHYQINFIYKKDVASIQTESFSTMKSVMRISTPEVTAMDLMHYPLHCGGMSNVATVIAELYEKIDSIQLLNLVKSQHQRAWVQRLGFILEKVGAAHLARDLKQYLDKQQRLNYVALTPYLQTTKNAIKDSRWKLIINSELDIDI